MKTTRVRVLVASVVGAVALSACGSDEIRPPFIEEKAAPIGALPGTIVVTTRGDLDYSLAVFDGSKSLNEVHGSDNDRSPAFGPNGRSVAVAFNESGVGGIAVRRGAQRDVLVKGSGYFDHPTWAPDGSRLAYAFHPNEGSWDIYVVDLTTLQTTQLTSTPAQDWYPSWAPSGDRIAFTSDRDGDNAIWMLTLSGSAQKLVDSIGEDAEPAWSPDGKKIVFSSNRELSNWQIHVVPAAGGADTRLVRSDTVDRFPAFSPDGKFILVSTGYLAVYAADGGKLPNGADRWKLADDLTYSAAWSPASS
jgi:TolB protein